MSTSPAPVERKVKTAAAWTYVAATALLAALGLVQADNSLLGALPDPVEAPLLGLLPAAVAYLAGYVARHTPRPPTPVTDPFGR
jgi:hypothetical protein